MLDLLTKNNKSPLDKCLGPYRESKKGDTH